MHTDTDSNHYYNRTHDHILIPAIRLISLPSSSLLYRVLAAAPDALLLLLLLLLTVLFIFITGALALNMIGREISATDEKYSSALFRSAARK